MIHIVSEVGAFMSSLFVIGLIFVVYLIVRVVVPAMIFIGIPYILWRCIQYWRSL